MVNIITVIKTVCRKTVHSTYLPSLRRKRRHSGIVYVLFGPCGPLQGTSKNRREEPDCMLPQSRVSF
ncbi:protein of unknown function [Serratia sp. Tan611]|nr:protein of unknown function [Serratia sp. Tan611]